MLKLIEPGIGVNPVETEVMFGNQALPYSRQVGIKYIANFRWNYYPTTFCQFLLQLVLAPAGVAQEEAELFAFCGNRFQVFQYSAKLKTSHYLKTIFRCRVAGLKCLKLFGGNRSTPAER